MRAHHARHIFAIAHKPAYGYPAALYSRARRPFGNTWQIIAGNGGSRIESVVNQASINYYGYTAVSVSERRAIVRSYGRDIPSAGYVTASSSYSTTIRDTADICTRHLSTMTMIVDRA